MTVSLDNTLSVFVLTKDHEKSIRDCLSSVAWADEIIIYDSGSTDNTLAICREFTDKIYQTDWPGYAVQRQRALSSTTKEWVLFVDADEYLSKALALEIRSLLQSQPRHDAYLLPRLNYFLGKPMRATYLVTKDYGIRLFRRQKATFPLKLVHETVEVDGSKAKLKNCLHHKTLNDITEILNKLTLYSNLAAQQLVRKRTGRTMFFPKILLKSSFTFLKYYFYQLGFLDGKTGFVYSVYKSHMVFYRSLRLYQYNKYL